MSKTLRILNLGVGVQSSTLLLMSLYEQLPPLDAAIFADTGWEPAAVYRYLDYLADECERGRVPLYCVSAGNIRDDALGKGSRFASLPLHVLNDDGSHGITHRQCTKEYKIQPIRAQVRALMAEAGADHVQQVIGISLDEMQRMRTADVGYITHVYPLVERRMTRGDCRLWIERHGFDQPPKSACLGCPLHNKRGWQEVRRVPEEWADVVEFDEAIRGGHVREGKEAIRGSAYLHSSCRPLPMVDLSTPEERGQLSFLDECQGMCGV